VTPSALHLEGLSKSFPARRSLRDTLLHPRSGLMLAALDRVSCDVAEGEFFGFLGENGAGKTTLFRILSTLVIPDAGTVQVLGTDITRDPATVRRLLTPVLVSERSLAWRLSAVENLRLYAAFYRMPRAAAESRIAELLHVVGLDNVGDRLVGTFSSGMKQRLMLARALLARPRVLLLDEPTRSLDPLAARAFRQFLKDDIGRGQGCTVLLATHDPDEVRELCDRIGVLHRGRMLGVGTPESLARELGVHRFRLVTTEPDHPAIERLGIDGVRLGGVTEVSEGWRAREIELPAGEALAARILADLLAAGVTVSRFERMELPLADLLERVVRERSGSAHA
jgi:ABC-2 type transport system ATP-binding protein